jgi:predicted DsbA family dithiol-disulfide isomerase
VLAVVMGGVLAGILLMAGPGGGGGPAPEKDERGLEIVAGQPGCITPGTVRVDYFYSPTCPACINAKPTIDRLVAEFGDTITFAHRCIRIHGEDAILCPEEIGEAGYQEAMAKANEYRIRATPTFVFNCDRAQVGIPSYSQLKGVVCGYEPGLAACVG